MNDAPARYLLPPMHTLRTLEALGRLRNFTRAAEELCLTASAVSHQIKAIESFYATKLFQRNRHDAVLTPAGERLLDVVRGVLQQLSEVGASLRQRDASQLSLTAPPSLASRWLMARLGGFLQHHASIDFRLRATSALVDLDAEEVDLGIRYGHGRWPGLRSEKLFGEEIFPVASPAYLAQMKVRRSTDLKRCQLLQDDFQSWGEWSAKVGWVLGHAAAGPVFSDSALLLQAAEAGQGVALARSVLVADAIAAGVLVRIGKWAMPAPGGYYLVAPSRRADTSSAAAFRDWLTQLTGQ
ncbi:LysR substrate-binding domain-containing protein [Dyella silvatica]|uniref:LysR substrate-binding domain-containing protein n=1 Tax=Dyella silvatica TaxID=2992128 RepID=UPI002251D152|nr:LysR substrate-binding domain-containing protein [Dyella silvatica]